jgi:hypothetical protein
MSDRSSWFSENYTILFSKKIDKQISKVKVCFVQALDESGDPPIKHRNTPDFVLLQRNTNIKPQYLVFVKKKIKIP